MLVPPAPMSPRPPADAPARPYEVAIVGNDAVLAALPARPLQLAHAILACGYDLVVPVSWGEEVVAEEALRTVSARGGAPAVFCACPTLRARLLASGSELAPFLLSLVAPSVATARYLRALQPEAPLRITLIGGCPDARDPSIDLRVAPRDFLRLLAERGIALDRQPELFESVVPPDRRRHYSLPGGCPTPRALESRAPGCRLATITEDAFPSELAELLLGSENVLIDLSSRLGCACCGGFGGREHRGPAGREEILRQEPPRSPAPVIDHDVVVACQHPVPATAAASDPSATPTSLAERPSPVQDKQMPPGDTTRTPRREGSTRGGGAWRARPGVEQGSPEAAACARLPAASSSDGARTRARKRHIAVTPAGAMVAIPAPARTSTYWAPARVAGAPDTVLARKEPHAATAPPLPAPAIATSPSVATTEAPTEAPTAAWGSMAPLPRRPSLSAFQVSRSAARASAGTAKVLPRAYVARRHAPTAPQVIRSDMIGSSPATPEGHDRDDLGGVAISSPGDVVEEWDVIARQGSAPAPTAPRGDTIGADVLARVRQQAHRPGRVVSRILAPPTEPREPGRLLVILTTAVLALALVVALAVIFRRAPTAPW